MNIAAADRIVELQRIVPFPRDLVWRAMTEVAHVNQWWGPDGFKNEGGSMDFRVGGVWSFDMVAPDGTRYPNRSVFKEIVPFSTLVFDHGDAENTLFEMTVTLEEIAQGTLISLRQHYVSKELRDQAVNRNGAIEGGKQHLAKLDRYLRDNRLNTLRERAVSLEPYSRP